MDDVKLNARELNRLRDIEAGIFISDRVYPQTTRRLVQLGFVHLGCGPITDAGRQWLKDHDA